MEQLVVSLPGFFCPTSHGFFGTSSHLRWFFCIFFRPLPPLHRFIFASPSHTTKKTERIRTFHTDTNYLVMSLCKRINHNQSLKIKSKLINLHNVCFLSNHVHNFPSLFTQKLFGSRDYEASYECSNRKYSFSWWFVSMHDDSKLGQHSPLFINVINRVHSYQF